MRQNGSGRIAPYCNTSGHSVQAVDSLKPLRELAAALVNVGMALTICSGKGPRAVIGLATMAGLGAWAAHSIGLLEGFCFWAISSWICLCKLLGAIAQVNSTGPALWGESRDPAWYGTWWFQWGMGLWLVALSAYMLMRKHRYSW